MGKVAQEAKNTVDDGNPAFFRRDPMLRELWYIPDYGYNGGFRSSAVVWSFGPKGLKNVSP